ncbi:hypothetical protein TIFTF001_028021 [Ficus carica]|uniref:Uncharacterized protein n=1 Tax=Ficus carica TaxID=3494 RepID=A0AA88IVW1_FICCA|nr:hypothetical protein TIFTF001_028021 [Ficus carica]
MREIEGGDGEGDGAIGGRAKEIIATPGRRFECQSYRRQEKGGHSHISARRQHSNGKGASASVASNQARAKKKANDERLRGEEREREERGGPSEGGETVGTVGGRRRKRGPIEYGEKGEGVYSGEERERSEGLRNFGENPRELRKMREMK